MNIKKNILVITLLILTLSPTQRAEALIFKPIEWIAEAASETVYYATKYTLKAGFWVVKTTAKGLWNGTKKGIKSARNNSSHKKDYVYDQYDLPPVPDMEELPTVTY